MIYREVARKLAVLGCHELLRRGGGSHRKWFNPETQQLTVVPDWGSQDLKTAPCVQPCGSWGSSGKTS